MGTNSAQPDQAIIGSFHADHRFAWMAGIHAASCDLGSHMGTPVGKAAPSSIRLKEALRETSSCQPLNLLLLSLQLCNGMCGADLHASAALRSNNNDSCSACPLHVQCDEDGTSESAEP